MPAALVLLSVYSLALVGAAHGLRALGRRSTSPWASRTLAGHLRATQEPPEDVSDEDWPHSEVPRLYAGMAIVAATAATALSIGGLALARDRIEGSVLLAVLVLSGLTVARMAAAFRS